MSRLTTKHPGMQYQEYKPSAYLQPYIDCYWTYAAPLTPSVEEQPINYCLPLGTAELIIHQEEEPSYLLNLTGQGWNKSYNAFLTGLFDHTASWKASPGSTTFGIRMKPEALSLLTGIPAGELFNQVGEAAVLLPARQKEFVKRLFVRQETALHILEAEQFFQQQISLSRQERDYVAEGCRLIRTSDGPLTIETLSTQLYISRRQLERNFRRHTGVNPKTYQQIIRFRNLYQHIRQHHHSSIKWASLSYPLGYADQAHLVRDCKKFSSFTPMRLASQQKGVFQSLEACSS